MKIISWNVNGIRAAYKKGLVDFLKREEPHLFCIQESKCQKDQVGPEFTDMLNYKSYWSCATRKGYSGVTTYSREEPSDVAYGIGVTEYDSEGRFVVTKHKDFSLYNIYFPNGGSGQERHDYKQKFLKDLQTHVAKRLKAGEQIIVVGDYNVAHREIDVYDPVKLSDESGFLPEEREWMTGFLNAGFVDTFRLLHPDAKDRYTWWDYRTMARMGNRGWRIDYICVSKGLEKRVTRAEILDHVEGSDHCPVVMELT
ncbi:MAG: exodeoxyribonuclease III [Bdellovibrionia bacterium]